ncbi:protein LURP-one-related 4-like [Senna tora]|uniref:Protein LURP-one-related 4-like n=1 Tax=Senna tora TaxID=362788 RepID=A0A834WQR7_9FABA|nr:protein LURP-one-related 4-like [Senna tora]
MAKIYPHHHHHKEEERLYYSGGSMNNNSKRERYTIWMKSLVFHSNGCTVYDSKGDIVYRVDNYDSKGISEVNLMDLKGTVLCTIHKRRVGFGSWDGFRNWSKKEEMTRWFQVKKCSKMAMLKKKNPKIACEMRVGTLHKYSIVSTAGKAPFLFNITNTDGLIVAEVKQKQSWSGVVLGDDVVTLDVEANTDHSLIVAFVMVYGLICGRM